MQDRASAVGFPLCFQFMEFGYKMFVPLVEWEDPRFQRLLELSVKHIIYVNDIFSFEKEFNAQNGNLNTTFNGVAVLSILGDIPISEAMNMMVEMTRDLERDILQLEEGIKCDEKVFTKVTLDFIEKIKYMMGGNYVVHTVAYARYLRVD